MWHGAWAPLGGLVLIAAAPAAADAPALGSAELISAARKEGTVNLYASNFLETERSLADAFKKRFPEINVEIVRAPGGQLITRIKTEAAANRLSADVMDISDRAQAGGMESLCAEYAPPNAADYPPETRTGKRLWPRSGNAWTLAWNTELVKDPPKSWWDLTRPEYGKLGLGQVVALSGGAPWMLVMFERKVMGEAFWVKQAATKPRLYPSQAPLVDAMIRGEVAMAALVTNLSIPYEQQGAPIKWLFPPEGVPLTLFAACVAATAPHPNAARLFMSWSLSREGQAAMVALGGFSGLRDAPLPPGVDRSAIKIWLPDPDEYESLRAPWIVDWNRIYEYRQ